VVLGIGVELGDVTGEQAPMERMEIMTITEAIVASKRLTILFASLSQYP
jgi:hypothetical protein